jgi:hypothetical protein
MKASPPILRKAASSPKKDADEKAEAEADENLRRDADLALL